MALSNIWREPRREITETVVGFITVALTFPYFYLNYRLAVWDFNNALANGKSVEQLMPVWAATFIFSAALPITLALGFGLLVLIHALGDWACDMLQGHGIQLRPKRRY